MAAGWVGGGMRTLWPSVKCGLTVIGSSPLNDMDIGRNISIDFTPQLRTLNMDTKS